MASDIFTILLKGDGHHDEGVCGAAISPGEAVRLQADTYYDPETLPQDAASRQPIKVAKEDALQGKTIADAYAEADVLFFYTAQPGDHLHLLVKAGEDIDIGDTLAVEGDGSGKFVEVTYADTMTLTVPLTTGKTHDAMATGLPAAAANDDMGIITGTPGTDAPTLQGVDFGGTTSDEKAAFEIILPHAYRAGSAITVVLRAAMLTTIADGSCTVDVECWKDAGDGAVGSDLCTTAAQSMNSLTPADLSFTITPTGLVAGDKLILRLSLAGTDSGDAGVMVPEISDVALTIGAFSEGKAQVEALEDTSGALASATHVKCRVL